MPWKTGTWLRGRASAACVGEGRGGDRERPMCHLWQIPVVDLGTVGMNPVGVILSYPSDSECATVLSVPATL